MLAMIKNNSSSEKNPFQEKKRCEVPITENTGSPEIRRIFQERGAISGRLADFEVRPQQVKMADAVEKVLANGGHLVVEAGTGVGKSFAYLIPAIKQVNRNSGRILISTFTITLQEQLINKDIPFLAELCEGNFNAVLAKGRGNYLCLRRLEFVIRKQKNLFDEFSSELAAIKKWANRTKDGSVANMTFAPSNKLWALVKSEHGNCRGRKCSYFQNCFYWRARRRLENANIIVANHALMFSDLALKQQGASVLPDYNFIIIDEAHNIEHTAEEHFGVNISNYTLKFLLNRLYNRKTHKGLLASVNAEKALKVVVAAHKQCEAFFKNVREWYQENYNQNTGRCYANFVDDCVSEPLKQVRQQLSKLVKNSGNEDEKREFSSNIDRCKKLEQDLKCFLEQGRKDYVYWTECGKNRKAATKLKSAAINVGPDIKKALFDKYNSVVLTSATLGSGIKGGKEDFEFFAGRVGLENFEPLKLGSPFDYEKQVKIYIEKNLPNPNHENFVEQAAEKIKKYVLQTKGKAFVLFTNYSMLQNTAEKLSKWLQTNKIELLQQGGGIDRSVLLKKFKAGDMCVLLGTDSFWQGVDVPGEALSNVIIVKLPFAVPDKPLLAGRLEQIRTEGKNAFFDYQLPSAIIKFKQGFGRLIRNKTDRGIVVILDSRIANKRYGKMFLDAIPKCQINIVQ